MKTGTGRMMIMVAALLLLAAPLMTPVYGEANAPTWSEGKTWAMGGKLDIGKLVQPSLDEAKDMGSAAGGKVDVKLDGEVGFYEIYKVSQAGSAEYVMNIHHGGGIHVSGSYDINIPATEYSDEMNMKGSGYFDWVFDIKGDVTYEKDTLAIKEINVKATTEVKAHYKGNYPEYDFNYETMETTTTMKDVDITIEGDATISVTVTFDPPLDIFDFPIEVGESWDVYSTATYSGNVKAHFDAKGLPKEMEEEIKNETGESLPLNMETPIPQGSYPVDLHLKCTGTKEITLPNGQTTTVYVIVPDDSYYYDPWEDDTWDDWEYYAYPMEPSDQVELYYSPDEGFIVGQNMNMGIPSDLTGGMGMGGSMTSEPVTFTLEPMTESEAEDGMNDIQKMPFRMNMLMWLLLIVVIAIVVIAVVMGIRRKRRKAQMMAPPGYAPGAPGYGQQPYPQYPQPPQQYPPQQYPPQQPPQGYQQPPQQYPPQGPQAQPYQQPPQGYQQPPQQYPPQKCAEPPYPPQVPKEI